MFGYFNDPDEQEAFYETFRREFEIRHHGRATVDDETAAYLDDDDEKEER